MEASNEAFVVEQVRGRPQYSITNNQINTTMRMISPATISGDMGGLSFRKDMIEIIFVNNKNPDNRVAGEWFEWPYYITAKDLGDTTDFSDTDFVLEVLDKYKEKFMGIKGMPPKNMDNLVRYEEFVRYIFPDIEEKREREGRQE